MIAVAWLALFLWPVAAINFFKRFVLPMAVCATIIGGYLLLPVNIGLDPPVLPAIDKTSIPSFCALILALIAIRSPLRTSPVLPGWLPREPVTLICFALLVSGAFGTASTNTDTLVFGWRVLQAMSLYDTLSALMEFAVMLIPFLLARKVLATAEGQRVLLIALGVSALIYTLPALWEVRMSPQLNTQIYGFFPHEFAQQMRNGGFRPVVFVGHGLSVAIFFTFAILATIGLVRSSPASERGTWMLASMWLFGTLVLCKTLGALLITMVLAPIAFFLRPKMQLLAATCIAVIVLTYPMLRAAHVIPIDDVMAFAESVNKDRARSFNTRIENEEILLERALERPLFGWGGWGRQRVFDEKGNDLSVTDGSWVIEIGNGGWFRYLGVFGLLCWPAIGLFLARRDRVDIVSSILALILAAKLIDLIPNSGMTPILWLIAGSLVGRLEIKTADLHAQSDEPVVDALKSKVPVYSRAPAPKYDGGKPQPAGYARNHGNQERTSRGRKTEGSEETRSGPAPRYAREKRPLRK